MTRESQKLREHQFLLHFKKLYARFPKGTILPEEAPDFIIDSADKKIGIELIEIFPNQTIEERTHLYLKESMHALIVSAQKEFESIYQRHLMVSLTFSERFRCSKSERRENARLLAEDVDNCYSRMKHDSKTFERFNSVGLRTPYIEHILIYPKEIRKGLWDSGIAALSRDLQFQELESCIRSKESTLPSIRIKAEEAWLLIVEPFDMLIYDSAYLFQEVNTGYDRVFMLRTIFDEVIEFK